MQEVSGQKLWLDEAMTHSEGFLTTLVNREGERDLSTVDVPSPAMFRHFLANKQ